MEPNRPTPEEPLAPEAPTCRDPDGNDRDHAHDPFAKPMFFLALLQLLLGAGALYRVQYGASTYWEEVVILGGLAVLWPIFLIEALYRVFFLAKGCRYREGWRAVLYTLMPPFRMGAPSLIRRGEIWLPIAGWRVYDRKLPELVDHFFAVPMIFLALLIIPLLVLEFTIPNTIRAHPGLRLGLDVSIAFIWVSFALEFVIKMSVAPRTLRAVRRHWIDLAIVLIPMFEFLLTQLAETGFVARLLRLTRVVNPQYLARMGQLYRLRGLIARVWTAFLVLGVLSRLFGKDPLASKLKRLRRQEEELVEELEDIREKIAEVERKIAERDAAQESAPVCEEEKV